VFDRYLLVLSDILLLIQNTGDPLQNPETYRTKKECIISAYDYISTIYSASNILFKRKTDS
jgi:hypothetical protein